MSSEHIERRPRAEIDRNYFLGDVLIRTGMATVAALLCIAALTPFTFAQAVTGGMYGYLAVMALFASLGVAALLLGRHLRRNATHWDRD
jgi:uncharacterized membrane protein